MVGVQGAIYEVEINTQDMTYKVRNIGQRKIVRSNELDGIKPPEHLNTLKAHAKKAMKRMGVAFETEIRGLDVKPREEKQILSEVEELLNGKEDK
jgi:hypothetical protein